MDTIKLIADKIAAKNIQSGFVQDLAILNEIKKSGVDVYSAIGTMMKTEIEILIKEKNG